MKSSKKIILSTAIASVLAAGSYAPLAAAEVAASATIASTYLWRGFELGSGTPAISGDLVYSNSGFYAGIWGSSGDGTAGTEYDLFAGYGGSIEQFSYDISYVSYIYPTGAFSETEGPGDFAEIVATIGFGPVSVTYKDNISGSDLGEAGRYAFTEDYSYLSVSAGVADFSFTLGMHDEGNGSPVTGDATHFDVTYGYNENLSFTASAIVDSDLVNEPEPTFVVTYSVPF